MTTDWSTSVARAMHELDGAAPAPPPFDSLEAPPMDAQSTVRNSTRILSAAVLVAALIVGLVVLVGRDHQSSVVVTPDVTNPTADPSISSTASTSPSSTSPTATLAALPSTTLSETDAERTRAQIDELTSMLAGDLDGDRIAVLLAARWTQLVEVRACMQAAGQLFELNDYRYPFAQPRGLGLDWWSESDPARVAIGFGYTAPLIPPDVSEPNPDGLSNGWESMSPAEQRAFTADSTRCGANDAPSYDDLNPDATVLLRELQTGLYDVIAAELFQAAVDRPWTACMQTTGFDLDSYFALSDWMETKVFAEGRDHRFEAAVAQATVDCKRGVLATAMTLLAPVVDGFVGAHGDEIESARDGWAALGSVAKATLGELNAQQDAADAAEAVASGVGSLRVTVGGGCPDNVAFLPDDGSTTPTFVTNDDVTDLDTEFVPGVPIAAIVCRYQAIVPAEIGQPGRGGELFSSTVLDLDTTTALATTANAIGTADIVSGCEPASNAPRYTAIAFQIAQRKEVVIWLKDWKQCPGMTNGVLDSGPLINGHGGEFLTLLDSIAPPAPVEPTG